MKKKNIKENKIKELFLNQKGMALLTTLIFVFILVTFAVALLVMTSNDTKLSALQRDSTKAFYIAEAGIERTLYDLKEDYKNSKDWDDDELEIIINGITLTPDGILYNGEDFYDGTDEGTYEGTYTVSLSNLTSSTVTIESKGVYNNKSTRYVQVDAKAGPLSVWANAIFAGAGASGRVINGNVDIRGSVHLLGEEGGGSTMDIGVEIGGTGGIGNNYLGMDSDLSDRITLNRPETSDGLKTLNANLYVKQGKVNLSGNATIGNPDVPDNDYKEQMVGVFVNTDIDKFGGNQGEINVYSDNETKENYYFGDAFELPTIDYDYIDSEGNTFPNPASDPPNQPYSCKKYYEDRGLKMYPFDSPEAITVSSISSDTERFWYPNPEGEPPNDLANLPEDDYGNYIYWDKDNRTLYIQGIIVIDEIIEDFTIGDKGNPIEYVGVGTIVSKKEEVGGGISIHGDLLAQGDNNFPEENALGLVAYNDINIATGHGDSQLEMMGAFYAKEKITSAKQNQMVGTFVSKYFDMGINVPSIYQVPGLENHLPPGMPGAVGLTEVSTSNWHEVHK